MPAEKFSQVTANVWVNGDARIAGAHADGVRVAPRTDDPGAVTVSTGADGGDVRAKVASTLDHAELRDVLGPGQVRVRR